MADRVQRERLDSFAPARKKWPARGSICASSKPGSVAELPALSQGFIALLAISHGGYLVSKTTDHSNSKPA
ncbi:hypothetical protein OWM54_25545 [Myxococcus sp. MISCRS1]|jgi:hypothetical protein|uniref:hypothetical protein n=1 Tax=unclassified Myxococcus TaxID=2648731 RepID=UPI001CBE5305|nr:MULTISPECIES: hypothetical protein [unclassified Myxococcus]MBZ4396432.1 hypothetical protein [Myxococcus sp. AS-1-15]MCY1000513.1 hypothetical protein [Myxococcus sp. MISCRS1]